MIRAAATAAWLIVSAVLLLTLAASHLVPAGTLFSLSASCRLEAQDQEPCLLCGMTRAFVAISEGKVDQAIAFNRWSVALYGVFLANGALAALWLAGRLARAILSYRAAGHVVRGVSTE